MNTRRWGALGAIQEADCYELFSWLHILLLWHFSALFTEKFLNILSFLHNSLKDKIIFKTSQCMIFLLFFLFPPFWLNLFQSDICPHHSTLLFQGHWWLLHCQIHWSFSVLISLDQLLASNTADHFLFFQTPSALVLQDTILFWLISFFTGSLTGIPQIC